MDIEPPIESMIAAFLKTTPVSIRSDLQRLKRARGIEYRDKKTFFELLRAVEDDAEMDKRIQHSVGMLHAADEGLTVGAVKGHRFTAKQKDRKPVKCFRCDGPHRVKDCPHPPFKPSN